MRPQPRQRSGLSCGRAGELLRVTTHSDQRLKVLGGERTPPRDLPAFPRGDADSRLGRGKVLEQTRDGDLHRVAFARFISPPCETRSQSTAFRERGISGGERNLKGRQNGKRKGGTRATPGIPPKVTFFFNRLQRQPLSKGIPLVSVGFAPK